jgi:hypothetical protein
LIHNKNKIPQGWIAAYARFVCICRPEREEKHRTRLTVGGGNLITNYHGYVSTNDMAGLELTKMHWLSVLSTKNAKCMTMDFGNFDFNTPLDRHEYMRIHINNIPQEVIEDEYKLYEENYVTDGFVHVKIWHALFGLKQSGALANPQLLKVLGKEGYYHSEHTSGLWQNKGHFIHFSSGWFWCKVYGQERCTALAISHQKIKRTYPTAVDWKCNQFLGVHLDWDYEVLTLKASMPPGYIKKRQYTTISTRSFEQATVWSVSIHCIELGHKAANDIHPWVTSIFKRRHKVILLQKVYGKFLYYVQTIDNVMIRPLNILSTKVTTGTEKTKSAMNHFFDYCSTNPDAFILYQACVVMILSILSNVAYLVKLEARSRAGGFFYIGNTDMEISSMDQS